ncbi:MAG: type II toxin-antitoxin system RelE/ParE family toxin [Deltaproteobacteria bacterium]|nr:type II toxin-antitoxin system RelE/ParE family toxin [Deltaproteobacteria bacterium]
MLAWSYHPDAEAEVEATVSWLTERDPLVANRFLDDLERSLQTMRETPQAFPLWPGVAGRLRLRRCVMLRFAFSIAFFVEREHLYVVAVAHQRRRPRYWARRLRTRT